jgi:hypothetical protein
MTEYNEFLKTKQSKFIPTGFDIDVSELHDSLFDFQKDIVRWALNKGKAAIFAGTGLGNELKESYYMQACKNLHRADRLAVAPKQVGLDYAFACPQQSVLEDI